MSDRAGGSLHGNTDRIERSIRIDAEAERVWQLIAQPGWWINDGRIGERRVERGGGIDVLLEATCGAFHVTTVEHDAPRYAAYRWNACGDADQVGREQPTLVEFWVEPQPDGGVLLRVVESGFDALDTAEQQRRQSMEEHRHGWEVELQAVLPYLSRT